MTVGHLAQYKNGEAATIKRRFDRGEASVLLGSGSFWEGVDFAQQAKIIQVIPRIPFDNPSDFFVQKLHETLRLEGKNPFYLTLEAGSWTLESFERARISGHFIRSTLIKSSIWFADSS